jgi:hypothetical protein
MFPLPRPSGIPTRSLSRAFVAVLALLLSALGGIRLGLDRLTGLDDEPALVASLSATDGSADRIDTSLCLAQGEAARQMRAEWVALPTERRLLETACSPPAPTQRLGSAGGPRAP